MATGVKPRDEESQLTRADLETIQDAMKSKKFRDMLSEYCQEVSDPANQMLYQKEMTQLEKERGYDVTFINPKGGYVIKTSVAGDRKAFINICSNENVSKPSYDIQVVNGQRGMNWQVPYSLIPPREDFDHKKERVVIYDVVFHPDTLRMAEVNQRFREIVNKTAFEGLQKSYSIHLDCNNLRFPKSYYKGMVTPAVIRKEDPNYKQTIDNEAEELSPELIDKLYPQHTYTNDLSGLNKQDESKTEKKSESKKIENEYNHYSDEGYTVPKYVVKQQRNVDMQEFTFHKDSKQHTATPSQLIVEVHLPLLSSTKDCILDVHEKTLFFKSEKPAKYKLNVKFPYSVNDECGCAKFDQTKHMLIVTLPVNRKTLSSESITSTKIDSGVESEENSQSDEDNKKERLIEEISSTYNCPNINNEPISTTTDTFFDPKVGYTLPSYTHNVLDDTLALTFHVKNTDPDSVKVEHDVNQIKIKFMSVGTGFVPVHYAATLKFEENITFSSVSGEAWDNNVILQLEVEHEIPQKYQIGINEMSMSWEYMDVSHIKKTTKFNSEELLNKNEHAPTIVEVTNLGNETNIIVSNKSDNCDEDDFESPDAPNAKEVVWTNIGSYDCNARSILRKSIKMSRSYSESSVGDIASSIDYVSSDCIPEESSLKKTVRFNDNIARQFYRYNSSIEGQKKKNQKKKSKRKNQERHKSESEAEDDAANGTKMTKSKSALKPRRDSGLADTSDAETDFKTQSEDEAFMKNPPTTSLLDIVDHDEKDIEDVSSENKVIQEPSDVGHEGEENSILNIVKENYESDPSEIWKSDFTIESEKREKDEPTTCENLKHKTDLYNPDKLNKGQYLEVTFKNDLIFDLDL